jgi:acetyl/propionyl-CoA carboxylase alpha subunit
MSETFKISGKRVALPRAAGGWKFQSRPGGWIIAERRAADGSLERHRFALHELRGRLSLNFGGFAWSGELAASDSRGGAAGGSDADLIAQFPGKVRKLLVQAGASVAAGDPLVMIEAMKMEFPVKAPYAGTVKRLLVTEGQQLSPGDRFLDLEGETGGG